MIIKCFFCEERNEFLNKFGTNFKILGGKESNLVKRKCLYQVEQSFHKWSGVFFWLKARSYVIIIIFRQEGIKLHKFLYTRVNKMDRRNKIKNNHPQKYFE
jgi:hypothetical protein